MVIIPCKVNFLLFLKQHVLYLKMDKKGEILKCKRIKKKGDLKIPVQLDVSCIDKPLLK